MSRDSKFGRFSADEEDGDEANWQDSYSDLMTDLLAIFVVLFSFAMMSQAVENSKASAAQNKIVEIEGVAILPNESGVLPEQDNLNSLIKLINDYISEEGLSDQMSAVKQGENQILLRVAGSFLFNSGKSDINSSADPLLGRISQILIEYEDFIKMIRIEGHTDDRPIKNSSLFDSNWDLSTSRAVNVLRRLSEISMIEPQKFSAVGYGEFHPIVGNDTEENRARNRRVDFIIEVENE